MFGASTFGETPFGAGPAEQTTGAVYAQLAGSFAIRQAVYAPLAGEYTIENSPQTGYTVPANRILRVGVEYVAEPLLMAEAFTRRLTDGRYSIAKDPEARKSYGADLAAVLEREGASSVELLGVSTEGVMLDGTPLVQGENEDLLTAWVIGGSRAVGVENFLCFHYRLDTGVEDDITLHFRIQDS